MRIVYIQQYIRDASRVAAVSQASGMLAHTDSFHAIVRKRNASLLHRVRTSINSVLIVDTDGYVGLSIA